MSTPNLSALAAYGGAYEKKLFATLMQELDIAKDITVMPGIKNKLNLTKLKVGNGVRPYREDFDSSDDDLMYSGTALEVEMIKRDIKINPLKYRDTWQAEVMAKGVNPTEIPFAQFVWDQVMKSFWAEINNNAYAAVYNANGTTAVAIANGFRKLIADAITDVKTTPVVTGVLTNVNAVAKVEQMVKAMPIPYRKAGFKVYVNYDNWDLYCEDYRERYKKYLEADTNGSYFVDRTARKVEIIPATWLGSSNRIICTPKENLLLGTDLMSATMTNFIRHEIVEARVLFPIGFQVRDWDAIKVNDQV